MDLKEFKKACATFKKEEPEGCPKCQTCGEYGTNCVLVPNTSGIAIECKNHHVIQNWDTSYKKFLTDFSETILVRTKESTWTIMDKTGNQAQYIRFINLNWEPFQPQ